MPANAVAIPGHMFRTRNDLRRQMGDRTYNLHVSKFRPLLRELAAKEPMLDVATRMSEKMLAIGVDGRWVTAALVEELEAANA